MFCFPGATGSGHAAGVWGGRWGAVSQRAQEVGGRREAIDHQRRRVEQAVAREQPGSPSDDEVCDEHQRVRDEHEALGAAWAATEARPAVKQRAFAATGAAMGWSLGQIITW